MDNNRKRHKAINRLAGNELAHILPIIYDMIMRGVSRNDIASNYNLHESTVDNYIKAYENYVNYGEIDRRIKRAIPYLKVRQASIKFTEQHGRKPAERLKPDVVVNEPTQPLKRYKQKAVNPTISQRKFRLLWGMIEINW